MKKNYTTPEISFTEFDLQGFLCQSIRIFVDEHYNYGAENEAEGFEGDHVLSW